MTNTTITAAMIATAAKYTGATLLDVRRVVLGLPPLNGDAAAIRRALVAAGADGRFLAQLSEGRRSIPGRGGNVGPAHEDTSTTDDT